MNARDQQPQTFASALYHVDSADPAAELIDRSGYSAAEVAEISSVMAALGRLRDAEQRLSDASQQYMRLGRTDMRALHYLIVAGNTDTITTAGSIASHLGISTASTTKLLDRLEQAGHITRAPHPTDRRALAIAITPHTREAAMRTVGTTQAKRFYAAARLSAKEREIVVRFLDDMTGELTLPDNPWPQQD